jgi:hypothetical protein
MAPVPGGGLRHARARILTPYGPASTAWVLDGGVLAVDLEIPPGARGRFVLPPGTRQAEHNARPVGVDSLPTSDAHDRPVLDLASGQHRIVLTRIAD